MWISHRNSGFTIVELLIVIVVIGILAAIVIVAYNGVTTKANQTTVANEARQWEKLIKIYQAQYGDIAGLANNTSYCLGTGFPASYCGLTPGPGASSYDESTGATVITELSKVGKLPLNSRKVVSAGYVGPYLRTMTGTYRIYTYMPGTDTQTCVTLGLTHVWMNGAGNTVQCSIDIAR